MTEQEIIIFRQKIYDFYYTNKRDFAWRNDISSYKVVVSEIMLQQTQTARVSYKFDEWMVAFPNFKTLAEATVAHVLSKWQGLGYNRRGLALHDFAKRVMTEFNGLVPENVETLQTFKNIGPNTAGSICAFSFNKPVTFIETNIRTVFIYEFFKDKKNIDDKQLLPLISETVDHQNPREWYYALMDYGVYLKKELKVSNAASKHYAKQSKFIGSKRQVRGIVIKILTRVNYVFLHDLQEMLFLELPNNTHCLTAVVEDLCKEGFLEKVETEPLLHDVLIRIIR